MYATLETRWENMHVREDRTGERAAGGQCAKRDRPRLRGCARRASSASRLPQPRSPRLCSRLFSCSKASLAMSLPSPPIAAHLARSSIVVGPASPASSSGPNSPLTSRPPSPTHRTAYAYPQTPDLASSYQPTPTATPAPSSAATSRATSLSKDPLLKPHPAPRGGRARRGSLRAQGAQGVSAWLRRALKRSENDDAGELELEERGRRSRRLSGGHAERAALPSDAVSGQSVTGAAAGKKGAKKLLMSRERAQFVCAFAMIALVGAPPPSAAAAL